METTRPRLGAEFFLNNRAKVRAQDLLGAVQGLVGRGRYQPSLFSLVDRALRSFGEDLKGYVLSFDDVFEGKGAAHADGSLVSLSLAGVWHLLQQSSFVAEGKQYEADLNQILSDEAVPYRLRGGSWVTTAASDGEVLRRLLLENGDEALSCKQGDVQVEMVASTVQAKLHADGAVLVDYGAGVGRVLAGLATASNFKKAKYIAVDEPLPDVVRNLAGSVGASAEFIERRDTFLSSEIVADVIMVVNTLHHVPFVDVVKQISALCGRLGEGGVLLVHEMGELRVPEQRNVAWRSEDLALLFKGEEFETNLRSTVSRTKVPLAHVIVALTGMGSVEDALKRNVPAVWRQMKQRALDEIRGLYDARDPAAEVALHHALIANANLDLNPVE